MTQGVWPKTDGDIFYALEANQTFYQSALGTTLNGRSLDITTAAEQIVAANSSRRRLLVKNRGSVAIYLGVAGVTTTTGFRLDIGKSKIFNHKEALYGITASGTADIRYLEVQ